MIFPAHFRPWYQWRTTSFLILLWSMLMIVPALGGEGMIPLKTEQAPIIDGVLDDPVWQQAPMVTNFKTFTPDFGKSMGHKTEVRMAYDQENLYFAFFCYDDPDEIKTSIAARDQIRQDDWVCINLDSYYDQQSLYAFYINPFGIQGDTRYSNGQEDPGADFVWYSKGTINEEGYAVEIRIPFRSIRYSVRDGKVKMGVIFERKVSRLSIQGTYPALDPELGLSGFLLQSMPLEFEDIKRNTLIELLPSVTYGEGTEFVEGDKERSGGKLDFGLTGKWGISSDLVLDATYNPDFSQVESDARQIDNNPAVFLSFFPNNDPFSRRAQRILSSPERPMRVCFRQSIPERS